MELFGKIVKNKENVRFMKIDNLLVDFKLQKSKFKIRDQVNHANVIGKFNKYYTKIVSLISNTFAK